MRPVATIAVLVTLAAGACGRFGYQPQSGGEDYCAVIPALPEPANIDGVLDPGVALTPLQPVGWKGAGAGVPAGQRAAYALAWRADGLYVYVEVVDPDRVPANDGLEPWCGDGVEVYVDSDGRFDHAPAYDDPGARQFVFAGPGDAAAAVKRGNAYCIGCGDTALPIDQAQFVAVPRTDGYAVEAFVAAADLALASWSLAASGQVGVDLSVNVSNPSAGDAQCGVLVGSGNRMGQYFLRVHPVDPFYPFVTAEAFCTATLTP